MNYDVVIGLEVHAELCTKSKIYCGCKNSFGLGVNTCCCPICMGFPGTLPMLNKKVVEYAIKMGHALNCKINGVSKQDRKNYFYPDLPKAYQISQAEIPLCESGYLDILVGSQEKRIGITRIHIEEDSGKLIHDSSFDGTLVDFNRSGVPLIEIVSEPDLTSGEEAKAYLETIKAILVYLGISDGKMQEGSIRCDVNVSIKEKGSKVLGTRCEMKNINTFNGALKAIEYEKNRQIELLESGIKIEQQTRRWDDAKGENFLLRSKEQAHDYRYFPEPDMLSIFIDDKEILDIKNSIGELPNKKISRYIKDYNLSQNESTILATDAERSKLFEEVLAMGNLNAKIVANWILGEILSYVNDKGISFGELSICSKDLFDLVSSIEKGIISNSAAKKVLIKFFETGSSIDQIIKSEGLVQNSNTSELESIVLKVIDDNQKSIADYKLGKTNAFGFLVGQCMKESKGTANPSIVKELLTKNIE